MKPRQLTALSRAALGALLVSVWLSLGCAATLFEVDDAVRFEDGDSRFVAFVQKKRGWVLRGVEGVEVRFAVDGSEVARATTDERGRFRFESLADGSYRCSIDSRARESVKATAGAADVVLRRSW